MSKERKIYIHIGIEKEQLNKVTGIAKNYGISEGVLIRHIIKKYLARKDRKQQQQ